MTDLPEAIFATPEMAAVFSGEGRVRRILDFEAALARAEARAGIIPARAAEAIGARCRVEDFDLPALFREAAVAGTLVIPLVRALTEAVGAEARGFVHWGATSQDAVDTGAMLQARDGLDLLRGALLAAGRACRALAEGHRHTLMAGRTLLQHAVPIPFGLKAAHWLGLVTRQAVRVRGLRERALMVQLGGAAGTLAALGSHGLRVMELLAEELGLGVPDLPWHTDRDGVAEIAATLGLVAGAMAKIATDVALLMQTEVGEVSEAPAPGKGGSSTMPQKRNPVDAPAALAAARLAMGQVSVVLSGMAQEHERALGAWPAEWEALPALFRHASGAVARVRAMLETLEVDPERMRRNLEAGGGRIMAEAVTMALAPRLGRDTAHRMVAEAVGRLGAGTDLRGALVAMAGEDPVLGSVLGGERIDEVLDPRRYLGSSEAFIDRAVERFEREALGSLPEP